MKDTTEFWKNWFDDRAKHTTSDFVLNRGTTLRLAELERQAERQLIESVAPGANDIVLDAGCGSGRNISLLAPLVRQVVALDFSKEMLVRLQTRLSGESLSNVTLEQGSVCKINHPDNSFDKVLCISVLQYLDENGCRAAFREMCRVCRNNGRVVVHIKNGSSLYGISKRFANAILVLFGREGLPEYYRSRRLHETMIAEAGGRILHAESFGVFTFVGLPRPLVRVALAIERRLQRLTWIRRLGVNYKLTIQVAKC